MKSAEERGPVVSIGMPTYNSEDRIGRSIDCMLQQDFREIELIISDNASKDETGRICQEYAALDRRVTYIRQPANIGQSANFDAVGQVARGEFFMWAHDDDIYAPTFVSTLVNELRQHQSAGLAMSGIRRVNREGEERDVLRWMDRDDPTGKSALRLAMSVAGDYTRKRHYHLFMFSMFRTALFQAASPYSDNRVPHPDRVFMTQFAMATPWRYVNQPLYVRTVHDRPMNLRLPDEAPNRMVNEDPLGYAKTVGAMFGYLIRSPVIPLRRKLIVPLVVLAGAWGYKYVLYRGDRFRIARRTLGVARRLARLLIRRKWSYSPKPTTPDGCEG